MDGYMKWNCYDLAEQMEAFAQCKRELNNIYEELSQQTRMIDLENTGISESMRNQLNRLAEAIDRLDIEENTLEQGIDIYYAAESQARNQVESLKASPGNTTITITDVAASVENVVMEDWLAALVFQQGR